MKRVSILKLAFAFNLLFGLNVAAQSSFPSDFYPEGEGKEVEIPGDPGDSTGATKNFMGILAASALQYYPTLPQAVNEKFYHTKQARGKFRIGMFHNFKPFTHLKVPSIHFHDPYFNTYIGELLMSTKNVQIGLSVTASRNGAGLIFSFDRNRSY